MVFLIIYLVGAVVWAFVCVKQNAEPIDLLALLWPIALIVCIPTIIARKFL